MARPRIFVETSTIKFSTTAVTLLVPRPYTFRFGNREYTEPLYSLEDVNPNDRITDKRFRAEIDLLPQIAALARGGLIELLSHLEVQDELSDITILGRRRTTLLEAPITMVDSPIRYSRPAGREWRIHFLSQLRWPRYLELRKACGANQGKKVKENQLVDAFLLWCAEKAGASHFLTCDFKLIRLIGGNRHFKSAVRVVGPSALLADLEPLLRPSATITPEK